MNSDTITRDAFQEDLTNIQVLMSTYFLDIEGLAIENFIVVMSGDKLLGAGAIIQGSFPEIHSIAVHPNYRGRGIGSTLLYALLGKLDAPHGQVYARTSSPVFFEKAGFQRLDPAMKAELWDDCATCDRFNICTRAVMCLDLRTVKRC